MGWMVENRSMFFPSCLSRPSCLSCPVPCHHLFVRILFIGDIVGRPGRELVRRGLAAIVDHHAVDFVIANAETGALLRTLEHPNTIGEPDWHSSYPLLAAGCSDGKVYFWNPDTGEQVGSTPNDSGSCGRVAFSHRGDLLVSGTWNRLVFWSPELPLSLGLDHSAPPTMWSALSPSPFSSMSALQTA